MTTDDQSRLNTPPFGPHPGAGRPGFTADGRLAGYSATDFPAPAGVPPVTDAAPPTYVRSPLLERAPARRRGFGSGLAAAALAAVIGAGAGIGSYATLVADRGPVTAPISVNTAPASQTPVLDGTVAAAAAKIQPSRGHHQRAGGQRQWRGQRRGAGRRRPHPDQQPRGRGAARPARITVTFANGSTTEGHVVGRLASNDLAVIKVPASTDLVPATFAASR